MNGLLREALAAHGGIDRWKRYGKVSATIVSGGDLFDAKGIKPDTTPRKVSTYTKAERMIATPFGEPDWKMIFVPDRVVIEDRNGAVVAERSNPKNAFIGHSYETPWDPVHRAYFSGYALWTYLNTPFFLTTRLIAPDFRSDCGADAHKYDHHIRTHQSWSQFPGEVT
jgi:hypothetical protein